MTFVKLLSLTKPENMEYQLVCYNGVPLADAPECSSYRTLVRSVIMTLNPNESTGARKSLSSPDGFTLHLDQRRPVVCAMVCRPGICMEDAFRVLEIMHARVAKLAPPTKAFEHQHTLGLLLPRLVAEPAPESVYDDCMLHCSSDSHCSSVCHSHSETCIHDEETMYSSDSLLSDNSIFGKKQHRVENTKTVWYIVGWLAVLFMTCIVIFLGVATWIYFKDYF